VVGEAVTALEGRRLVGHGGVRFCVSGVLTPLVVGGAATAYLKVACDLTERRRERRRQRGSARGRSESVGHLLTSRRVRYMVCPALLTPSKEFREQLRPPESEAPAASSSLGVGR